MSEMAERVAKALYNKRYENWEDVPPWPPKGVCPGLSWDCNEWLAFARAGMAAMREPTEAMYEAGGPENNPGVIWRAMIDSALKE